MSFWIYDLEINENIQLDQNTIQKPISSTTVWRDLEGESKD